VSNCYQIKERVRGFRGKKNRIIEYLIFNWWKEAEENAGRHHVRGRGIKKRKATTRRDGRGMGPCNQFLKKSQLVRGGGRGVDLETK